MKIQDLFDVYNIDHIKAYKVLMDTGSWPHGFIPKDIEMSLNWQIILAGKFTSAWVEQALAGKIIGIPKYE